MPISVNNSFISSTVNPLKSGRVNVFDDFKIVIFKSFILSPASIWLAYEIIVFSSSSGL